MFGSILVGMLVSAAPGIPCMDISVGPHYASYLLFQNEEEAKGRWHFGGEIGMANFIPHIGMKIRGAMLRYDAPLEQGPYTYEYAPLVFCASFDLLPFVSVRWFEFTAETGLGVYWWKGLYDDEVIVLPNGDKMSETDIGFVGGLTLRLNPLKHLGIEYATRYHYMATSNIYKYGFLDTDDKIWEHGAGIKFIMPFGR